MPETRDQSWPSTLSSRIRSDYLEMDRIGYACATPRRRGRAGAYRWHSPAPWSTMRPRKGQIHGSEKGNGAVDGVGRRTPDKEAEFNRWYNEEHLAERLAIPGFLNGARYEAVKGGPKHLAVYELESPA